MQLPIFLYPVSAARSSDTWHVILELYFSHESKVKVPRGAFLPHVLTFSFCSFPSIGPPPPLLTKILVALYSHQGQGGGVKSSRVESTRLYSGPGARQGYARSGYTCTHTNTHTCTLICTITGKPMYSKTSIKNT